MLGVGITPDGEGDSVFSPAVLVSMQKAEKNVSWRKT